METLFLVITVILFVCMIVMNLNKNNEPFD